jgi:hypothetical protein
MAEYAGFARLTGWMPGVICGVRWGSHWLHQWRLALARPKSCLATSHSPSGVQRKQASRSHWRGWLLALLIVIILFSTARALMPWAVRDYVNRTLDRNQLYSGRIGPVRIHLWRGAYSIQDVQISKTTGNIPVPLFSAKQVDFAVQWRNLLHGRIVGRVLLEEPQINFVDSSTSADSQTGAGGPWLEMISDLFPFKINSAIVQKGSIHFRTFQSQKPVDVYLSEVQGSIENLTNIRNETAPLISTVQATGLVMDQAKLDYKMTLDPFSYHPTFHMALRVLGLDVTRLNDLALAYGKFDFKRGWLDLVVETDAKEGQLNGYVKPLFRDLKVFSPAQDVREDNVLQFFWQALVGAVTTVFKNHPRNQFGTLIPFSGEVSGTTSTDILATLGNVLRNAFVRAYLPRLESGQQEVDGLKFEPPDISSPGSSGVGQ